MAEKQEERLVRLLGFGEQKLKHVREKLALVNTLETDLLLSEDITAESDILAAIKAAIDDIGDAAIDTGRQYYANELRRALALRLSEIKLTYKKRKEARIECKPSSQMTADELSHLAWQIAQSPEKRATLQKLFESMQPAATLQPKDATSLRNREPNES